MSYTVSFRPEAEADLFALYQYIADHSRHRRAGNSRVRIARVFYAGRDYEALFKARD